MSPPIQGDPGAGPSLARTSFSKSCSFQAFVRGNPYFWATFGLRAPSGVKTPLAPLTKILDLPMHVFFCVWKLVSHVPVHNTIYCGSLCTGSKLKLFVIYYVWLFFTYSGRCLDGTCLVCSPGTYANQLSECLPCPEGFSTRGKGSTSITDCKCLSDFIISSLHTELFEQQKIFCCPQNNASVFSPNWFQQVCAFQLWCPVHQDSTKMWMVALLALRAVINPRIPR